MRKRFTYLAVLFFLLIFGVGCGKKDKAQGSKAKLQIHPQIFGSGPSLVIGGDEEGDGGGKYYKFIPFFCLDQEGGMYIPDITNFCIDKYSSGGEFLHSFGRKGEGPGEFLHAMNSFAVDSGGRLVASYFWKNKLAQFGKDGRLIEEHPLPESFKDMMIYRLDFNPFDNRLYILVFSEEKGFQLGAYDLEGREFTVIHSDNKRTRVTLACFLPKFAFDTLGNVYVIDTVDYRIYKYSPGGKILDTFEKKVEVEKERIREKDYNINISGKIVRHRKASLFVGQLTGDSRFFPALFSIDIDGDRIYAWRSHQDRERKFLVDIYSLDFKYIATTSLYSVIGNAGNLKGRLVRIKNDKLYTLNISSDNDEFKAKIGKLGLFDWPYKLEVYPLKKDVR